MKSPLLNILCLPLLALALMPAACATTSSVHKYYWADLTEKHAMLDIITLSQDLLDKANEYSQTIEFPPDTYAQSGPCVPNSETIPAEMLPKGTPISLLTQNGPSTHSVSGHCAGYGAGETHWLVFLEPAPKSQESSVLAAAPGVFPPNARLRKVPEAAPLSQADLQLALLLKPQLCPEPVPELAQSLCKNLTFTQDSTQVIRGNFGGGYNALVFFLWNIEGDGIELYSAWFAVNEASKQTLVLAQPTQSIYYNWGDFIGDVDGDGIDELVYSSAYYEGHYFLLLDWDGETPDMQTLTGDGA